MKTFRTTKIFSLYSIPMHVEILMQTSGSGKSFVD